MTNILVTGTAGFIAYHLVQRLLDDGHAVTGIDNLNAYYDVNLKLARLLQLQQHAAFKFIKMDLNDNEALLALCKLQHFDYVIHLAAQPGVRYALKNPRAYLESNVLGFFNILEACRQYPVKHLLYASSSSVYGANAKLPFSVHDQVDHPLSLYAATKKSNELMAHTYSHLYAMPTTGLRFFTVYGPWGRPDMAMFGFTRDIFQGNTIKLFNYGNHYRAFTYVDDIIESMVRVLPKIPSPSNELIRDKMIVTSANSYAPWRVYNVANRHPVQLLEYIKILEKHTGRVAITALMPPQSGDMQDTAADVSDLTALIDYTPQIDIDEGVRRFVLWYKAYYSVV